LLEWAAIRPSAGSQSERRATSLWRSGNFNIEQVDLRASGKQRACLTYGGRHADIHMTIN